MNESGRGEIDGKRYYFTFSMNSVHCPSPGWLNYPASFSAPAARYHQQGRKSAPAKYAASGHRDPSQVISQASFRKRIAFVTHNEWEWRRETSRRGHVRSSATSQAPKERASLILNIGCFDWDHPQEQLLNCTECTQRRGALSVWASGECLLCSLWGWKCFITGDASVHARDVWPQNNWKGQDKSEQRETGGCSIHHRLLDHVFYGMKHSERNVTLKEIKRSVTKQY